jgi:hypothetical protein
MLPNVPARLLLRLRLLGICSLVNDSIEFNEKVARGATFREIVYFYARRCTAPSRCGVAVKKTDYVGEMGVT